MEFSDFLSELKITATGEVTSDNSYVVTLKNSDEFSRVYTMLDKYEDADFDSESSIMESETTTLVYLTDFFDITLEADFVNNKYTLTLEEVEE